MDASGFGGRKVASGEKGSYLIGYLPHSLQGMMTGLHQDTLVFP